MTIREAIAFGVRMLADVPDPKLDTVELLCNVTGEQALPLQLNASRTLTVEQEERFRSLLLLRANRTPLQYLLGTRCFYGLDFRVDERVLIPRQETETLCENALLRMRALTAPRVLDVCTGSGAIAVTLRAQCPQAVVTATDISADALALAEENAARHGVDIRFLQGDLLAPVLGEQFDVIVSNPPYIPTQACETLQPEVLREPRLALDGGADGLDFYRKLAADAPACLCAGGSLLLEVGDGQAESVGALLQDTGAFTEILQVWDLYGKLRVVAARRDAFPT